MDLRELIAKGNEIAGNQTELAKLIGISSNYLTNAKTGRSGLPDYACIKLAEIIGAPPIEVIAASALVTEKNEERRKVFYPFVMGKAASFAAAAILIGTTALPSESHAMSGPAKQGQYAIYIMSNCLREWLEKFKKQLSMSLAFGYAA